MTCQSYMSALQTSDQPINMVVFITEQFAPKL